MPLQQSKVKPTPAVIVSAVIAACLLLALLLLGKAEYRNLALLIALLLLGAYLLVCMISRAGARSLCTIFTRATVTAVREHKGYFRIDVRYSAYGSEVNGTVEYFESSYPGIGQDVGLFYAEDAPKLCMLQIYKNYKPGWSSVTEKKYKQRMLATLGCAILSVALFVAFVMTEEITGIALYIPLVLGLVLAVESLWQALRLPRVLKEIEELQNGIPFFKPNQSKS